MSLHPVRVEPILAQLGTCDSGAYHSNHSSGWRNICDTLLAPGSRTGPRYMQNPRGCLSSRKTNHMRAAHIQSPAQWPYGQFGRRRAGEGREGELGERSERNDRVPRMAWMLSAYRVDDGVAIFLGRLPDSEVVRMQVPVLAWIARIEYRSATYSYCEAGWLGGELRRKETKLGSAWRAGLGQSVVEA